MYSGRRRAGRGKAGGGEVLCELYADERGRLFTLGSVESRRIDIMPDLVRSGM